jgi:hypothetical protein
MVGTIQEGEMPPIQYWIVHPSARMNAQQKQDLVTALQSSLGNKTVLNSGIIP